MIGIKIADLKLLVSRMRTLKTSFLTVNCFAEKNSMNLFLILIIYRLFRLIVGFFNDNLDYFTNLDYDYFGAPWMEGGFEGYPEEKLWKTGNGGFSLRRVSTFISILEQILSSQKGKMPVFKTIPNSPKAVIKNFGIRNNLKHYIKKAPGEDIFWCVYVPQIFNQSEFYIADTITAAHYAFEVLPRFSFMTRLRTGNHPWAVIIGKVMILLSGRITYFEFKYFKFLPLNLLELQMLSLICYSCFEYA